MDKNNLQTPDFLIRWSDQSSHSSEQIYWGIPDQEKDSKLRNGAASLHTDTTHVEVSEMLWSEPTTMSFTPNLIAFTALISTTSTVEYGYGEGLTVTCGDSGTLLFMLPGREIHATLSPGRMRTVTVSFEHQYAESLIGPLHDLSPTKLYDALNLRSSLISAILLRLMHEAIYPGAISDQIVRSFGHAVLVECAHWLQQSNEQRRPGRQLTPADFETIEQLLAGVPGKSATVTDLAAACGLSERYFAKLFREQTGTSVSEYIRAHRVSRAKTLLRDTDLPLKEIAYRLGYSNAANFSSFFRTATGITPGQFRKQQ